MKAAVKAATWQQLVHGQDVARENMRTKTRMRNEHHGPSNKFLLGDAGVRPRSHRQTVPFGLSIEWQSVARRTRFDLIQFLPEMDEEQAAEIYVASRLLSYQNSSVRLLVRDI